MLTEPEIKSPLQDYNLNLPNAFAPADRYERLRDIKTLNIEKIRNARMLVVGAGAVGNEVIKNLALFGVGNIFIVDIDHVEKSNLTRSVLFREKDTNRRSHKAITAGKRAKELNPDCNIVALNADICYGVGLGLIRRMDAVMSCVDSRFARLLINRFCFWNNKSWINCGILDAEGICTVYQPGVNDYESELSPAAWSAISKRFGCPDVARHMISEGSTPTTPISASIIGAIQVSEAMKLLHGYTDQLLAGIEFRFDLRTNEYRLIECKDINEFSESSLRFDQVRETTLGAHSTVAELKSEIEKITGASEYEIRLRDIIVTKITREADNKVFRMILPESKLAKHLEDKGIRDVKADTGLNRIFINDKVESIVNTDNRFDTIPLKKMGVPELDILQVRTADKGTLYFELTHDIVKYNL